MARTSESDGNGTRPAGPAITALGVKGFKSLFDRCRIEFGNLTVLAGANSSGKSSMLQPLLILRQTLEANYDPGALLIDGPNVKFSQSRQLFSRLPGVKESSEICVSVELENGESLETIYRKDSSGRIVPKEATYISDKGQFTIFEDMPSSTIKKTIQNFIPEANSFANSLIKKEGFSWTVITDRCFIAPWLVSKNSRMLRIGWGPVGAIESAIRNVIHVPARRGNPERTYKTTTHGPRFPGAFDSYVASIVHHWKLEKAKELRTLNSQLKILGLTWKVDTKLVDETRIEIRVGRLTHGTRGGARDLISMADVGFGVSQVLPVLVALLVAKPGQFVYLEQPEIHLHPKAQGNLATVLAQVAKRGVRIILETHSARLLMGIRTLVAEQKLPPALVKLHWFTRAPETGLTQVATATLDESGSFGDWPEDFGQVELDQESRLLDAVETRQFS